VISAWLIWASFQKDLLGNHVLKKWGLLFGILIWLVTLLLGIKSIGGVIG
jgi:Mn2+/Fe2+ NRAMP family transporter